MGTTLDNLKPSLKAYVEEWRPQLMPKNETQNFDAFKAISNEF